MSGRAGLRIVVHLLAIALMGIWTTQAGLAEEVAHAGGGSTLPANLDGSRPPAREDAAGGGKDFDAIDTSITVQPRRLGKRDELREGDTKPRPFARHIFRPRRSAHESPGGTTRDAIASPVVRHDGMEQGSGQRRDLPALRHDPATAPTGIGANASSDVAKPGGAFGHTLSNAKQIVRPAALNRGAINGTSLARRGLGSSSIGGPAKPIAGINGTTIRPTH